MQQVENPDSIITYAVHECESCGACLSAMEVDKLIKRQVVDVVIKKVVTEHRAEVKVCKCRARMSAHFPKCVKAPVQAGDNVKAIALYLSLN